MRIALLTTMLLLSSAAIAGARGPSLQFGVAVSLSDSTGCIAGTRLRLEPGDSVAILAFQGTKPVRARVASQLVDECFPNQGVFGDSVFTYSLMVRSNPNSDWAPGLGVSNLQIVAQTDSDHISFWVPGLPDTFIVRDCSSSEGFHTFVRCNGKLLYHEYYYVPWSTESDCTDQDFDDVPVR